ncbi:MAG: lipase family protein, partial [Bauldia sp.]
PEGATAHLVLYRSTGLNGEPIAVSGVVIIPNNEVPRDGRPIVAWGHPTTGVADTCAPSLSPLQYAELPGVAQMLERGYIIAATDYPGLGTPGVHPYIVGISEGRAVLDSIRAAQAIAGSQATDRVALWGHSQGGHASIWASLLAPDYAPEFTIEGIALAAPATELVTLIRDDAPTDDGKYLSALAVWSWSQVYAMPIENVVEADMLPVVNDVVTYCDSTIRGLIGQRADDRLLDAGFLSVDITTTQPWEGHLADNTPGPTPAGIPVFIAQGTADQVVDPPVTQNYFDNLCAAGRTATLHIMPGIDHDRAGIAAAATAVAWIADRFAGTAAPNGCPG